VFRETREAPVGVLVNPRVVSASGEQAAFEEGCLILTLDRAEPEERRRAIAVLREGDRLPALRHA
jgi:peptide deformylase